MKTSVQGVAKTFQMAEAVLNNEHLGEDSVTDLLAISISSTDAIGHSFGTRGKENHDVYMELDRQLAHFLQVLDRKVGRGNYLLFLSADHGASHNPNVLKEHKMPAGGLETWNNWKPLQEHLSKEIGVNGNIIKDENAGRIYLDHELIEKSGKSLDEVKAIVIKALEQEENIL